MKIGPSLEFHIVNVNTYVYMYMLIYMYNFIQFFYQLRTTKMRRVLRKYKHRKRILHNMLKQKKDMDTIDEHNKQMENIMKNKMFRRCR